MLDYDAFNLKNVSEVDDEIYLTKGNEKFLIKEK